MRIREHALYWPNPYARLSVLFAIAAGLALNLRSRSRVGNTRRLPSWQSSGVLPFLLLCWAVVDSDDHLALLRKEPDLLHSLSILQLLAIHAQRDTCCRQPHVLRCRLSKTVDRGVSANVCSQVAVSVT